MTKENIEKIDAILGAAGDWLRFSGSTWIVYSESTAVDIATAVRTVLKSDDSDIVAECNPHSLSGWGPGWIDTWLNKYKDAVPLLSKD